MRIDGKVYLKVRSNVYCLMSFLQCTTIDMHALALTIQETELSELILLSFVLVNLEVLERVGVLGRGNDTIRHSV